MVFSSTTNPLIDIVNARPLVVACAAAKREHPHQQRSLTAATTSRSCCPLARSEAVETTRSAGSPPGVVISSALHGLVDPDTVIAPYDLKIGQPGMQPAGGRLRSARRVPTRSSPCCPRPTSGARRRHSHRQRGRHVGIELMDASEAAPGIGYQRGVAASLPASAGSIGRQPQ